jgi:hypothetical protein
MNEDIDNININLLQSSESYICFTVNDHGIANSIEQAQTNGFKYLKMKFLSKLVEQYEDRIMVSNGVTFKTDLS